MTQALVPYTSGILGLIALVIIILILGPLVAAKKAAAKVKPGRVMFEIDGVTELVAREALRLAAMKLPVKTRTVVREDW